MTCLLCHTVEDVERGLNISVPELLFIRGAGQEVTWSALVDMASIASSKVASLLKYRIETSVYKDAKFGCPGESESR